MASPEAAQRKLDLQVRRARLHAERYGTPEQVERLVEKMNQPTLGDNTLAQAFTLEAVNDLMEEISGNSIPEEEILEEEKIGEYRADSDAEEGSEEWQPSHLSPADQGNQGEIPEDVAKAVNEGDAEGQVASEETQNLPEDENKDDPKTSTSDQERKSAKRGSKQ
jgi:hypothetical protein